MTGTMQIYVTFDDLRVDPRLAAPRAFTDNEFEGCIHANVKEVLLQRALQSVWHVKRLQRNDRPRIWRKPRNLTVLHRHGKDAIPIGVQQQIHGDHRRE